MMFEEIYENILKLWTEFELQPPEILEVLGITGIAVGSAALFLYLKLEEGKSFKAEEKRCKQEEKSAREPAAADVALPSSKLQELQHERKLLLDVHHAATLSHKEQFAERCMCLLMSCPNVVNIPREPYGFTPFLSACWAGSLPLVRFMLENGADMERRTKDGDTPLYLATRALLEMQDRPRPSLLHVLVDAGASVNAANHMGYTPLHLAASRGSKSLVRWLLDQGASPCLRNKRGYRPIDLAKLEGHEKVVSLLTVVSNQDNLVTCAYDTSPSVSSSSSSSSFRSVSSPQVKINESLPVSSPQVKINESLPARRYSRRPSVVPLVPADELQSVHVKPDEACRGTNES